MTWNFDTTNIPRGRVETRPRTIKGKNGEPDKIVFYDDFISDHIWAFTPGGDVVETWFIPEKSKVDPARWHNMNSKHEPVAWQPFVKPEPPIARHMPQQGAYVPVIEDVGSGA